MAERTRFRRLRRRHEVWMTYTVDGEIRGPKLLGRCWTRAGARRWRMELEHNPQIGAAVATAALSGCSIIPTFETRERW